MEKVERIYNLLRKEYGVRHCWISEIAEHLGINYQDANVLTIALGYERGRCTTTPTPLETFSHNARVKRVIDKIRDDF